MNQIRVELDQWGTDCTGRTRPYPLVSARHGALCRANRWHSHFCKYHCPYLASSSHSKSLPFRKFSSSKSRSLRQSESPSASLGMSLASSLVSQSLLQSSSSSSSSISSSASFENSSFSSLMGELFEQVNSKCSDKVTSSSFLAFVFDLVTVRTDD
ncbi:hypothetical protein BpHYR1_002110 [Brachionus plicatilis]|uniref:Uncharacterized protein n=1 Tax=Brachionus plicatilis TaxID=10195 RepID=A0A3M7T926_BRAPC|nr:hypothetical protein BpHYR1_002110 [Brachionus plicatilis]